MVEIFSNNDHILSNFPICLRKTVEELCLRSKISFRSIDLTDITINSIRSNNRDALDNFHFILNVPYAGKNLKWEIIFDPENFDFAPDFDFNDDEFLSYFDIDTITDNVPSWKNWNLKNPNALSQVLSEFLCLYKQHQVRKLHLENIYSRYSDEYKVLIDDKNGIDEENIEVIVDGGSIHFLIRINVDCSSLPEYVQPIIYKGNNLSEHTLYNQGDDFAHLKVSVSKLDGSRSNYSIQLSPRLEQVIGNFKLSFADVPKDGTLTELVSRVSKTLESHLEQIVDHHKMKKIYITHLAAVCFENIIEYDSQYFSKAAFLQNVDDYNCLVTITIGTKFPLEKPSVSLSSIYCSEAKSCSKLLDTYPYNPEFKPEVNIEYLLEYLQDVIQDFQNHKH
ncbi:BRISC and BRCA1-A complex member 2-like [Diorhabda carinulata]|uniref:BRISC and BRCA1-A complex member 2-like n=1 Tax=Diorhabda carinulata TaxID=1163345 RepID=UPI0025A16710|nr:BRISC and BRCA1-A complex member 2-like [Diorhabda carinulata]